MVETTLALLIFLVPLAYSPGPGNMFFAAIGARFGLRATLVANLGYHLATFAVTLSIGLGFVAVAEQMPRLFDGLKVAGSLYVLWLAYRLANAGPTDGAEAEGVAGFRDGVMLLILNPKAYVIIGLMFSQFLAGAGPDRGALVLWITAVFTLNNMLAFVIWTALGDAIAQRFRSDQGARRLNRGFGAVLASVAVWMLLG